MMQPVKCKACGKIQDNLMSENGRLYACGAREVTGYVCQNCHKRQSWGVRGHVGQGEKKSGDRS